MEESEDYSVAMNMTGGNSTWMGTNRTIEEFGNYTVAMNMTGGNGTGNVANATLPIDMQFNEGHLVSIIMYSILMVFSAIGNTTVLILIMHRKGNSRSRINTMLMHLAIADLLVTFIIMPTEIGWAYTVTWDAGDAMCRIMAFFRMFGPYLSSFVLVCISLDRYYAVLKPLHLMDVDRRGKLMLSVAWGCSILCSLPQTVVFHVQHHPNFTWYNQCITYNAFPSYEHELTYSLFGLVTMYPLPLIIIIYSYTSIIREINKRSGKSFTDKIRRSSIGFLERAKIRTLKMTVVIVVVFFVCWTPYYVMSLWYCFDRDTAVQVDQRIQKGLFLFACTNSCMNPVVYGIFNIRNGKGDTRTSQRLASCTSRAVQNGTDVVCRVSWRRTTTGSRLHLNEKPNALARESLALFSNPQDSPKISQENLNRSNNGQNSAYARHCFTITPQIRTTML